MATSRKHTKRHRGSQSRTVKKQSNSRFLNIGVAALVVVLLGFGTFQLFDDDYHQAAPGASVVQADTDSLERLSLTGNQDQKSLDVVPITDRETRYLGPASDPATVSLAEAGQLGQPTLLWFHADWCHVCQRVKPEVIDLGEQYDGKVKIVRLNVDHGESSPAVGRYGVRATPTFVLFDEAGQLRGNVPGWPGLQAFSTAFDTLLAGG